jgi:hypothetical protein
MPVTFIPFGELSPDQKLFNNNANGALIECNNVVPIFNHYVAAPGAGTDSVGVGGLSGLLMSGRHAHSIGGDKYKLYFARGGFAHQLIEVDLDAGTSVDRTRATGGNYAFAADNVSGWQFTSYGTSVYATNFADDIQILQEGDTKFSKANITTPPTSAGTGAPSAGDPRARYISSIRNHLLLGHYSVGGVTTPTGVWWSGTDTPRFFGTPGTTPWLTNSDKQPIEDGFGHVTGLSSGGDWAVIFKERSVVRMEGPPFSFRTVVRGTGCRYPNSIVQVGDDTYYWGEAGPTVLRGGEGPPLVLGASGMVRTLIDNGTGFSTLSIQIGLDRAEVYGAADVANSLIWWSYRTNSSGQCVTLVYNYAEGRFSFIPPRIESTFSAWTRMLVQVPDTGRQWCPGRGIVVVAQSFSSEISEIVGRLAIGGTVRPRFTTAYYELLAGKSSRIVRIRPIYSMASGTSGINVAVTVRTRNEPYGASLTDSSSATDGAGWVYMPKSISGNFHQFQIDFLEGRQSTSEAVEMDGFEVDYAEQGLN